MTTSNLTLESVLPRLGESYKAWKEHEAGKNEHKNDFFELANRAIEARGLAMKVVEIPAKDESTSVERARRHYPGWNVDEHRLHRWKKDTYEIVLMEDPALKSFSHEVDGVKYTRQVSKGSVLVDDEWLAEEDPKLLERVSWNTPWGDRLMVPLDKMDKEDFGKLSRYLYNDKPRISLAAPKPVKEKD